MTGLLLTLLFLWTPETGRTAIIEHTDPEDPVSNAASGIPVLMYHHVSDPVDGYYGVSIRRFLSDLEKLCDAGFYLITPPDLENGLMQVPADRRPLMLTFDDGWQDNFMFLEGSTEIDPHCVVGILEQFCDLNPEFGRGVTFFISWDKIPFGQEEYITEKFNLLIDMGYSIGNHTNMHTNFMTLPRTKWDRAVLLPMENFHRRLGLRTSEIFAMAYPGGRFPKDQGAEEFLSHFQFQNVQAVRMGFLANGSVSSMNRLLDSPEGIFRIGRLDMSQYSVRRLLDWRNIMKTGPRESLHTPLLPRLRQPLQFITI
ncbi:MAG: polysaccharide deacetylase family protein [Candidatus Fermentibacteraceae bacterium]|nr:polysaccharide deacetylase family protein [Candidatus Fermentibacteraceae bacterium]